MEQQDVPQVSSPVVSEDSKTQTGLPVAPVVTTDKPTPGTQTPESNLLAALHEERARRKELEDKLNNLTTTETSDEDVYSDEGKLLKKHITTLEQKIASIEEEKNLEKIFNQYPLLRDKASDFIEYRNTEHPRAKLESVAKLFLSENGLLEPTRKGLEAPTGGSRTPMTSDMTAADVENLRKTNYRKYKEMLMNDQIKFTS